MKKTIKKISFIFLLLCGWQYAMAQPTTSAPTPTHDAADVVSLFSDHYTTTGKGLEPQSWGGSTVTRITISGTNDEILQSSGGSCAIFTSGWTAQKKGTVRMDVYSATGGTFSFGLSVSYSNDHTWLSGYDWPTVPKAQWTTIEVPVIEFVKAGLDDAVNVQGIRFSMTGTYYVDNIYAYGDKEIYVEPVDIPVAPTPAHSASVVKSVFSDSYTASQKGVTPQSFSGDGWEGATVVAKIMPYKSNTSENALRLSGLGKSLSTIDTWNISTCNFIHLDVYYAGGGDGTFYFAMNHNNWSGKNIITVTEDYNWPQTVEGQWVSIDIPTSMFVDAGLDITKITQIQFRGTGNFYIDNLYAYQDDSAVIPVEPPTTVPTITLDASNVKSIFCEQFETAGYQDSELGMTDLDSEGKLMWYGQNATQDREFVELVAGNKSIYLTHWNDYPFKIHKNSSTMDLSDMDYLHVSVYQMGDLDIFNKPVTVTFWMHDNNQKSVTSDVASVQMKRGEWVSVSIPLCYFENKELDLSNAYVLRLRQGGYPEMDIYVDNIFAYKGEPIGTVADECEPDDDECDDIVLDDSAGTLPPANQAFLGVNLASASGGTNPGTLGTSYKYPNNADLHYFKSKGMRLIRLPFRWKRIQSEAGGELTTQDINEMKRVIAEAERLGMWVMPDMHDYAEYTRNDTVFTIDGRYRTTNANGYWGPWKTTPEGGVGMKEFADVWAKLANAFKDYSNIWGYDLMNEPKDVDIEGLRDSYQLVINEIRKIDTKPYIVVEGKSYASAQSWPNVSDELKNLTDPTGKEIIYQAHTYFDSDNSGTYGDDYDTEVGSNATVYKTRLDPFVNWLKTNDKRGMLGEFGVPYNGAEQSDERYMTLLDNVCQYLKENQLTATYWTGGTFYETYHLTAQPSKDWCYERSTMKVLEKYVADFNVTSIDKIGEDDKQQISIYPNPVVDKLTINSTGAIKSISVYNLMGQLVFEQKPDDSEKQCSIDFSGYTKGSYLLRTTLKNGEFSVQKIVKQ